MLLVLMLLGLLSLTLSRFGFYNSPEGSGSASFLDWVTGVVVLLFAIEYGLGRGVHYPLAAMLTICTVLGATFALVIANPMYPQLLFFLILGGLIGSLFLSARAPAVVFFITLVGVVSLSVF